jgi:hypothetical protein
MKSYLLIILALAVPAFARDTYLANIGSSSDAGYLIADYLYAQSFITGPNSGGYALNSISMMQGGRSVGATGFSLSVFNDNGGGPGASLGVLSGDSDPGLGLFTYTSPGLTLSPSTTYWLVAAATSSGDSGYTWNMTWQRTGYTSLGGWSIDIAGNSQAYRNRTWNYWDVRSSEGGLMQFSIDAGVVPEPSSIGLLFLGVVLLGTRKYSRALFG